MSDEKADGAAASPSEFAFARFKEQVETDPSIPTSLATVVKKASASDLQALLGEIRSALGVTREN